MSITKEQIMEAISEMSIMDITELVSMMEKKFNVSSVVSATPVEPVKNVEEQTEFDVILNSIGTNKIAVIKAVRSSINLGLKEAKDLVESAPVTLKTGITKDEANSLKQYLQDAGASVEVK